MRRTLPWLALLLLVGSGCARRVPNVSIQDPRLTADSRRLLADAEDELAIARAREQDARATLGREQAWRRELNDRLSDQVKELRGPFGDLAAARVDAARAAVDAAEARHAVSVARLARTRADTVQRHDLAVVELEPLTREVARAREAAAEAERDLAKARAEAESLADIAWAAWSEAATSREPPTALFRAQPNEPFVP